MTTDNFTDIPARASVRDWHPERPLRNIDPEAGLGGLRALQANKKLERALRAAVYMAVVLALFVLATVKLDRLNMAATLVLGQMPVLLLVWWLYTRQRRAFLLAASNAENEVRERNRKLQAQVTEGTRELLMLAQELSLSNDGLRREMDARAKVEVELRQAQKLESVGRLAAGVAHEINTPVQFVNDSIHFLSEGVSDMTRLVGCYREALATLPEGARRPCFELEQEVDLGYLLEKLPRAIDSSIEGLGRVARIVRSMKEFAHPDGSEMAEADINHAIESTLVIARNEYKYVADVHTEWADLPMVPVYLSELNQAVLNIVVNAAHAIAEKVEGTEERGCITVRTTKLADEVVISISDTGNGIPTDIQDKIFDPFFTTKEVGRGTGQGLGVVHSVIVEKHHGRLFFDTEEGQGTTFHLHIPVHSENASRQPVATEAVLSEIESND